MADSSIFVMSSHHEGFPSVLLEAQSKGLPCVSFAFKEGPAEIIDDGVNGFLVEAENVEALAEKLYQLMNDQTLRESFSRMAQKDLARFKPERVLQDWDRMLSTL